MLHSIIIVFLLLISSIAVADEKPGLYINSTTFYDSEPIPFREFEKDWHADYRQGDTALSYQWHELGLRYARWGFGFIRRSHIYMKFDSQTALAVHTLANKQPIPEKTFIVDVDVKSFKASGFRLFRQLVSKPTFQWQSGVTLLYGRNLIDGTLRGEMTALSESDYEFNNVVLDYYYDKDKLFDHQVPAPVGKGFSLDSSFFWEPSSRLNLRLTVKDLLARIYWKKTPVTVAVIESDNKSYDENGYVKVDPLLKGNQTTRDFTQYLPVNVSMAAKMKLTNNNYISTEIEYFDIKTYSRFGVGKQLANNYQLEFSYDPFNSAPGLRLSHELFQFSLMSDHIKPDKAHLFALVFNLHYEW